VSAPILELDGLCASVGSLEILKGVDLSVGPGEIHAIMGPNGSGKSTLAHVLAGRPGPRVTAGSVRLDGRDLLALAPHERARAGLFVGLQQPVEVPGVTAFDALSHAGVSTDGLLERLRASAVSVGLRADLLERPLNVDLSGGERKRNEVVQLSVLKPQVAVLDEVDSGLDIDALEDVGAALRAAVDEWGLSIVAITHFRRILDVVRPTAVHAFVRGRIVESGTEELLARIGAEGYAGFTTS
jgi:Fe-S cluster assembly ATP-binding protein